MNYIGALSNKIKNILKPTGIKIAFKIHGFTHLLNKKDKLSNLYKCGIYKLKLAIVIVFTWGGLTETLKWE